MKLNKISKVNAVGLVGASALCLLVAAMLCPTVPKTTSALQCDSSSAECQEGYSESVSQLDLDVPVASVISIGLQNEMTIEITPKSTDINIAKGVAKLSVDTNNTSGYAVYMSAPGKNGTNLVNDTDNAQITTIEGEGVALTANKWGYKIGPAGTAGTGGENVTTFNAIPAASSKITSTNSVDTSETDTYDLTFGVAIDTDLPAGMYSGSVVVSAVANPIQITNLRQLTYMQDMTSAICEQTPMEFTKQLVDSRDGKKYWVAKLRDGNCWMTQNLALDLNTGRTLTPADTNISTNWAPTSNTDSVAFTGSQGNTTQTNQYSWGKWKNTVLATPLYGRNCNSGRGSDQYNSIISTEQLYQVCSGEGFVDVSQPGWQPTYKAQEGSIRLLPGNSTDRADTNYAGDGYLYEGLIAADVNNQTFDAHYLVGNYYQYNAATAGTGGSITNANATSSICPKGWTLPRSGNQAAIVGSLNSNNGTFYNLLNAYGVASTVRSVNNDLADTSTLYTATTTLRDYTKQLTSTAIVDGGTTTYQVKAGEYNIAADPLYFVRSGLVNVYNGYLRHAGISGLYWGRSGSAATNAYDLNFNDSGVYPSNGPNARYSGFSLRCLQE